MSPDVITKATATTGHPDVTRWGGNDLLAQDRYWVNRDKQLVLIADMSADYAANAADFLLRRANDWFHDPGEYIQETCTWIPGHDGEELARHSTLYRALRDRATRPGTGR